LELIGFDPTTSLMRIELKLENRMAWYVYIVECSDGTLYTGISNHIVKRIREHNSGIGSKYTRGRRPVKLVARWNCIDKSQAAKMEYRIKGLTRKEKLRSINDGQV
jgi:putative endonuclease